MRLFPKKKDRVTIVVPRGRHTYGKGKDPEIVGRPRIANQLAVGSRIGSFCSIARGLQFLFRGKHNVNWVTTYPFHAKWREKDTPWDPSFEPDPIVIENDVWIATNVKIMQGVTVGDGAVIAQESFVTKDVPPYAIVGGHPAKIIRYRFTEEQISELLKIAWWNWDDEAIEKVVPQLLSENIDKFIHGANKITGSVYE